MPITHQQALDYFRSPDLIGLGFEADAVRRLHPEDVVSYIIDRNINYTNLVRKAFAHESKGIFH